MSRATIDYGIDLGTTNSAIAVIRGTETDVFKDNEGFEHMPSAVWINRKGELVVGRAAKENSENDSLNAATEFKLQMGTQGFEIIFERSGRRMKAEELSAEVLKTLKENVARRAGEDIRAAVITVPAAFELPQCNATRRAAELAGLAVSPLLQEPVAAALAYGFQSEQDKVFWLVYDLGGGTFDAAVIQVRDGMIQVVNHEGDNHLGGKLFDWEIVERLLVPAVTREHRVADFRRGNQKWSSAFAKLKLHAEKAKIRLSRDNTADISIDFLCQDDRGEPVQFDYELQRSDLERLTEPYIVRSINICRKALESKRLATDHIEKVLLVGGPTLMPYLRARLEDPKEGLGIPLEFNVDPLTVVARGAAIFAGTQRLEGIDGDMTTAMPGKYALELDYKPVGSDPEPLVGGRVLAADGESFAGFTLVFSNPAARPPWQSGKIAVNPNGAFMTRLLAERGQNAFMIELFDATGSRLETVPNTLTYTMGIAIDAQPLIHSLGVALVSNEVAWFFEKGKPLPARKMEVRRTAYDVRKGQGGDLLQIPVVEGGNRRADRNRLVGWLHIPGDRIRRDLPAGSEIEITIDIDQSRLVRTKAFIPLLDEEFEAVIKLEKQAPEPGKLEDELQREKKRLEEAKSRAQSVRDLKTYELLQRLEGENILQDLQGLLAACRVDPDAADKCEKRLLDLKLAVDAVEDALEWPALVAQAEDDLKRTREIVDEYGNSTDKRQLGAFDEEIRKAMETRNADYLRLKLDELTGLRIRVLREQPGWWVGWLDHLKKEKHTMSDRSQAEQLFAQGDRAINSGDVPALQAAVRQLWQLVPADKREDVPEEYKSIVAR